MVPGSQKRADTTLIRNFCWPYKSSFIVLYFSLCFRLSNTSRWAECGITLSSGQGRKSSYRLQQSSMNYTLSRSVRLYIVNSFTLELKINPQSTCICSCYEQVGYPLYIYLPFQVILLDTSATTIKLSIFADGLCNYKVVNCGLYPTGRALCVQVCQQTVASMVRLKRKCSQTLPSIYIQHLAAVR